MTPCPATIAENRTKHLVSYVSWISIHLRGTVGLHPPARRRGNDNDCIESQNAKEPGEDSYATRRRSNLQNL